MLFLMLTGELPGAGLPSNGVLPAALRSICDRATAGNAADRYPDVTSLAADVRRYRAGLAVAAHRETSSNGRSVSPGRIGLPFSSSQPTW